MEAGWRDRAARLQARRAETPAVDARAALTRWQTAALESIGAVNADSAFDEAAATLLAARQAGFLARARPSASPSRCAMPTRCCAATAC